MQGYHANYQKRCIDFIEQGHLIICNDEYYLGTGMYFWDHLSEAKWWLSEKGKEMIVKAELKIDDQNLLDLTDTEVCDLLEKLLERLDHALMKTYNIKSIAGVKNCLGREIDALFDGFQKYLGRFSVVKGRRFYDKKKGSFFLQNSNLTDKSVDIFSVRKQEAIGKKEIVKI